MFALKARGHEKTSLHCLLAMLLVLPPCLASWRLKGVCFIYWCCELWCLHHHHMLWVVVFEPSPHVVRCGVCTITTCCELWCLHHHYMLWVVVFAPSPHVVSCGVCKHQNSQHLVSKLDKTINILLSRINL